MGENQNGRPAMSGADEELDAMRAVASALGRLDRDSARRVLRWAAERFELQAVLEPAIQVRSAGVPTPAPHGVGVLAPDSGNPPDLATLFAEAGPETGPEKALVAGYFQQAVMGAQELDAQSINTDLKHLGHPLTNVTKTLSFLINRSPSLMIQTKKLGRGQQARKRYKLTAAGIARVREMLARASGEEASQD